MSAPNGAAGNSSAIRTGRGESASASRAQASRNWNLGSTGAYYPERLGLGVLLALFIWFTRRAPAMFFSGDDMTNMYGAWNTDAWQLARAQLLVWEPAYRPVGGAVYRLFYAAFGFHPLPLYVFCWLLLLANVLVCYLFFRQVTAGAAEALTALSLVLVHGSFDDLYYSAGTIYDRLCFLFTTAALAIYFRFRRKPSGRYFALICLLSVLAMGSKENGVALLPLLFACEILFFRNFQVEGAARESFRDRLSRVAPLFTALAALSALFVFGRMNRTPDLVSNPSYALHPSLTIWLTHVAGYLSVLTYHQGSFTFVSAGILLGVLALAALAARNRTMLFGWLFFLICITPVALINPRAGYVLYLPELGLGLFCSAAITWLSTPLARVFPNTPAITFVLVTVAVTWLHMRNWPAPWTLQESPEYRLTEQFRREYPSLPHNSKLLFISDDFPATAYDLQFNLCLLYHDKSIVAYRLHGVPEQRPDPIYPPVYDHIFSSESGHYAELDNQNQPESIRLHILRGFAVDREMDMSRDDHSAYVVFGLQDGQSNRPSYWTDPRAEFKFKLHRAPAAFTAKFWLPEYVAEPAGRTLSILVNGNAIGSVPLTKQGMNEVTLPVPPNVTRNEGYTLVDLNVANPYQDARGSEYGIVLLRAGFEY